MSMAIRNSRIPPAIVNAGSVIPRYASKGRPITPITRITTAATATASLITRWRRCGAFAVETSVSGIMPTGSMIVIAVANAVAAN